MLEVTPCSIDQKDPTSGRVICSYYYKDIEGFTQVTGYPGGFAIAHGGFSRLVSLLRCVTHDLGGV